MAGKVLTVDCDNVLCNTAHAFLQYYHEVYGQQVPFENLSEPYPHQIAYFPEFGKDDVFAAYLEFFAYAEERDWLLPLPGALPVLQQLQADGYDLQVITGRALSQQKNTHVWLEQHFPGIFSEVFFCNDSSLSEIPKGQVCKQVGSVLHLDDFYHYAETVAAENIPSLLFDNPRNATCETTEYIIRVTGRDEVLSRLGETLS